MSIPDWGEGQASELRITQTEFTPEEVRYGLGGPSSDAAWLALIEKRIARSPFGAVTTFIGDPRAGGTTISR
jgi:hypothetical protein